MQLTKKRYFFLSLAAGVLILTFAVMNRQSPPLKPAAERSTPVRVTEVIEQEIAPKISGFGRVTPKVSWKAIAEVSGKIIYRHPDLEKGRTLKAGEVLLKIDPLDYQLQLARATADQSASQAQLARLDLEEENLKASLNIEKKRLELSNKELVRRKGLLDKGMLSQSDYDQQNLSYLSQQSQVLNLENQLALVPDNRTVTEAQLRINEAKVIEAQQALKDTIIVLPVNARVATVDFELGQAVNMQQQLAELYGIETMEVEAQVALHDARILMKSISESVSDYRSIRPEDFGLTARLIISSGEFQTTKSAVVSRVSESIDPNQGTVGIILEARQDYQALASKRQIPLANGLFVEARIEGQAQQHLIVPEGALHGNTLYLADTDNRMQPVNVTVLFRRDNLAAVQGDLQAGDRVITNDLVPAIKGMKLKVAEETL